VGIAGQTRGIQTEHLLEYNYEYYESRHFLSDLARSMRKEGVLPGRESPDFELESTEGNRIRLSHLRGRPVLLHFTSLT